MFSNAQPEFLSGAHNPRFRGRYRYTKPNRDIVDCQLIQIAQNNGMPQKRRNAQYLAPQQRYDLFKSQIVFRIRPLRYQFDPGLLFRSFIQADEIRMPPPGVSSGIDSLQFSSTRR
jgi:hypothetical protein